MFLLLLALIIILGLHCSNSTLIDYNKASLENFSTLDQPHMNDRNNLNNKSGNNHINIIIGENQCE